MRRALQVACTVLGLCLAGGRMVCAQAQQSIALKSGESVELGSVWWVAHCKSIMVAQPEVEILEGPPGLTLSIKEAMVVPRRLNCTNEVPGAILVATATNVSELVQGTLVYRIKYKTKDGERQTANTYNVSLFPETDRR
jgi:hypothetical protein